MCSPATRKRSAKRPARRPPRPRRAGRLRSSRKAEEEGRAQAEGEEIVTDASKTRLLPPSRGRIAELGGLPPSAAWRGERRIAPRARWRALPLTPLTLRVSRPLPQGARDYDRHPQPQSRGQRRRRASLDERASRRRQAQQLHHQLRPAAPGRARRAAADHGARRRDRRAGRPAHRSAPPRHRETDRIQDLRPGAALLRPPRLRLADVPGAQLRARHREIDGARGAASGPVHPRADGGADPHLQPHAPARQPHHGRRRDDPEPVAVRGPRGHDAILRAGVGRADARQLFPARRGALRSAAQAARGHGRLAR